VEDSTESRVGEVWSGQTDRHLLSPMQAQLAAQEN
jgi:hypothetical protein